MMTFVNNLVISYYSDHKFLIAGDFTLPLVNWINDVCCGVSNGVFTKLFADDIRIYTDVSVNSTSLDLQISLDCVSNWAKTWQMDITFTKCNVISYRNRKIVPKYYISIYYLMLILLLILVFM